MCSWGSDFVVCSCGKITNNFQFVFCVLLILVCWENQDWEKATLAFADMFPSFPVRRVLPHCHSSVRSDYSPRGIQPLTNDLCKALTKQEGETFVGMPTE